ncbi:FecR family protein [Usitatibacter palustris]|uniref:FecR protein domain-containing protein n=1 Tax=Usitatibacter palustris TaxID=2732487 RepID=A0A6M4H949_9PROT|nr:FecR family protein [Usitatibacter palustris]QJR14914.1 hypothetical protein DSM104440_01729 [Usitatibacter palustris]
MKTLKISRLRYAIALALAATVGDAAAASGSFTFVTGEVSVTKANGQRVTAQRGTEVDPGDSITTGASGMAQLTMIDQARLSLRPNTQFRIEGYQRSADSSEGAVLSLVRGTLRAFTGLIASSNRDKFVMKTRVATVGIRGSGNILYACRADECDKSVTGLGQGNDQDFTVNHTIEGSHAVTNVVDAAAGLPPQQGGAQTLITGPGQTVMIQGAQAPRYVPTPTFISDTATNPTGAAKTAATASDAAATRDFAPGDNQQLSASQQASSTPVGNNGLGFVTIDASNNLLSDPIGLNDVIISTGGPFLGQAVPASIRLEGNTAALRGYTAYSGTQSNLSPDIAGGTLREMHTVNVATGLTVILGRWEGASLSFSGIGGGPTAGNIHWAYASSGYPTYLSDVLTGTATYTLAQATAPTNQNNTTGTVGTATMNVNFTNRTLGVTISVSMPAAGANAGGTWGATASDVPFSLNTFFATTADRLRVSNGSTQSGSGQLLSGAIEGSFVGANLQGAIIGYGIADFTASNPANHNQINGVLLLTGPAQNGAATYREGRVSDPSGYLANSGFSRNFSTTNRPEEVIAGANGAVTQFTAPLFAGVGSRATYALGTAQVVQSGFDAETGLVWGRWGNGVATVTGNGQTQPINLQSASLHYIFAGPQQGPVTLPLTGTGVYDVIGNTSPTDSAGHVGTFGSATLDANFTNRTASATVNVTVNGQNWIGTAPNMPIYRDQYFSATTGSTVPGIPNLSPLGIACTPSCVGATGSFDGFFTGRSGQRAGLMYNMGGVQGGVAFGRRGG